MVKRDRISVAVAGAAVATLAVVVWFRADPAAPGSATSSADSRAPARLGPAVPAIELEPAGDRPPAAVGKRDLFAFGVPPTPEPTPEPPPTVPTPPPPPTIPTPTPMPPLTDVRFVGILESKPGVMVAMFLLGRDKDPKAEAVSGQVGDMVANRFRVVKVGLESVDILEVGADQTRRLPLKGK
jgi:hypothetical protein